MRTLQAGLIMVIGGTQYDTSGLICEAAVSLPLINDPYKSALAMLHLPWKQQVFHFVHSIATAML